jgi:hypothetical protein
VLNGQRRYYAVAKEKLIPEPPETDGTGPRARFRELGASVFSVPKSEIDEREAQWRKDRLSDQDAEPDE